jgi:hypothetical protein
MSFTLPTYGVVHTREKTITPHTGGVNDIQARGKTITTTGLCMENNTQTPRPIQYKKSKQRNNELYCFDKWTTPLAECRKEHYKIFMNFKFKSKLQCMEF